MLNTKAERLSLPHSPFGVQLCFLLLQRSGNRHGISPHLNLQLFEELDLWPNLIHTSAQEHYLRYLSLHRSPQCFERKDIWWGNLIATVTVPSGSILAPGGSPWAWIGALDQHFSDCGLRST